MCYFILSKLFMIFIRFWLIPFSSGFSISLLSNSLISRNAWFFLFLIYFMMFNNCFYCSPFSRCPTPIPLLSCLYSSLSSSFLILIFFLHFPPQTLKFPFVLLPILFGTSFLLTTIYNFLHFHFEIFEFFLVHEYTIASYFRTSLYSYIFYFIP